LIDLFRRPPPPPSLPTPPQFSRTHFPEKVTPFLLSQTSSYFLFPPDRASLFFFSSIDLRPLFSSLTFSVASSPVNQRANNQVSFPFFRLSTDGDPPRPDRSARTTFPLLYRRPSTFMSLRFRKVSPEPVRMTRPLWSGRTSFHAHIYLSQDLSLLVFDKNLSGPV